MSETWKSTGNLGGVTSYSKKVKLLMEEPIYKVLSATVVGSMAANKSLEFIDICLGVLSSMVEAAPPSSAYFSFKTLAVISLK